MQRGAGASPHRGRGAGFGRGGRGRHSGPSPSETGSFADGVWHCNCTPRLPAPNFRVKKEGPNKDRWFWTCQLPKDKSCGFFLWNEDAKPREIAAVMSNSRTEPKQPGKPQGEPAIEKSTLPHGKGLFAPVAATTGRVFQASVTPSPEAPKHQRQPAKRTATSAMLDDNSDGDEFALGDDDEEVFAAVADHVAATHTTPHKATMPGVYATPGTTVERKSTRKLPWLKESLAAPVFPTPDSASRRPSSPTTLHAERKAANFEETEAPATPSKPPVHPSAASSRSINPRTPSPTLPASSATLSAATNPSPAPARFRDALADPADDEASLTREVLALFAPMPPPTTSAPLLSAQQQQQRHHHLPALPALPASTHEALRRLLSTHDLRAQGVARGRDAARVALRKKDLRIADLERSVAMLEAERDADRAALRRMRSAKAQGRGEVLGFGA